MKICEECGCCNKWLVDWHWEFVRCSECMTKYWPAEFNTLKDKSLARYELEKYEAWLKEQESKKDVA